MKRMFCISIAAAIIVLNACKKDDENNETEPDPQPNIETLLTTVEVGTNGGSVSANNFTLIVPEGCFSAVHTLKLYSVSDDEFESNACTPYYRLSGMPASFAKSVTIEMQPQGDLSNNSYIAIGFNQYLKSLDSSIVTHSFLKTVLNSGTLSTTYSPDPPVSGSGQSKADPIDWHLTAATGYNELGDEKGHFKIYYPIAMITEEDAIRVKAEFETAYQTIASMGFSYEARTSWPFEVYIKQLDKAEGYFVQGFWSHNGDYIEIDDDVVVSEQDLKTTSGHEFFHFAQSLYYPGSECFLWMDEASATWIEEKFVDSPIHYTPLNQKLNNMSPFNGLLGGIGTTTESKHGYGMAAMMRYLVGIYGESFLSEIYTKISQGKDIMTALMESTNDPYLWYHEFLKEYMDGNIYDDNGLFGFKDSHFGEMKTANTNGQGMVQTFTASCSDLSGRFYLVTPIYGLYPEYTDIKLKIDKDYAKLFLYKFRVGPYSGFELIGETGDSLLIKDYEQIVSDDWTLLALVANSRSVPPYTMVNNINLNIKITEGLYLENMTRAEVDVRVGGEYFDSNMQTSTDQFTVSSQGKQDFSVSGTTYSWTHYTAYESWEYTFTIDKENKIVTQFSIFRSYEDETLLNLFSATGIEIPLEFSSTEVISFNLDGSSICNHLTSVENTHQNLGTGYSKELQNIICDPPFNRWIKIQMN